MAPIRVALVGAAGQTGSSIVDGLLEAEDEFSIVALTRPSSITKPANGKLKDRGVEIRPFDLSGPEGPLVEALRGIDVLISAIAATDQDAQIPLATVAKKAQVKRFVPCAFITVAPPGRMMLRDWKEDVYNHIKRIHLPYTIIDVGWWYQIGYPRLPSGKIDYVAMDVPTLIGDGTVPSALTDLRDIGRYVAKIVADERTLNKYVLAYDEVWTPNQVVEELERLSGETIPRKYLSEQMLRERIETAAKLYETDLSQAFLKASAEYMLSWGVYGDNTPENAKYLGYLTSKELYPDFQPISFINYLQEVLDGKAKPVYEDNEAIRTLTISLRKAMDSKA